MKTLLAILLLAGGSSLAQEPAGLDLDTTGENFLRAAGRVTGGALNITHNHGWDGARRCGFDRYRDHDRH